MKPENPRKQFHKTHRGILSVFRRLLNLEEAYTKPYVRFMRQARDWHYPAWRKVLDIAIYIGALVLYLAGAAAVISVCGLLIMGVAKLCFSHMW